MSVEIEDSWRHLETVGVLGVWAVVGLIMAPIVLRGMARRESGERDHVQLPRHAARREGHQGPRQQPAEALDVHYQTVGYPERGEYSPSLYLALRIAEYFEAPVEVIFSTSPFPRIGSTERSAQNKEPLRP